MRKIVGWIIFHQRDVWGGKGIERNCDMVEDISDRGTSPRKGNILVSSRNLHISFRTDYIEGNNMG